MENVNSNPPQNDQDLKKMVDSIMTSNEYNNRA
jgi:hypothetical protein